MLSFSPIQVVLIRERLCALHPIGGEDDHVREPERADGRDPTTPGACDTDTGMESPERAPGGMTQ
jgi:hypothetical protein